MLSDALANRVMKGMYAELFSDHISILTSNPNGGTQQNITCSSPAGSPQAVLSLSDLVLPANGLLEPAKPGLGFLEPKILELVVLQWAVLPRISLQLVARGPALRGTLCRELGSFELV